MNINLPPDIETMALRAVKLGSYESVADFIAAAIRQSTIHESLADTEAAASEKMLPYTQWKQKFEALIAGFPARETDNRVDCSRESIYGDDGR